MSAVTLIVPGDLDDKIIPARYVVCWRCQGTGVHDHEAFADGFNGTEEWCDDDFLADYVAGAYDVPCSVCDGERVVLEPDPERCTPEQLATYEAHEQALAEIAAEETAERRMGA
jgi:hypothetical protein